MSMQENAGRVKHYGLNLPTEGIGELDKAAVNTGILICGSFIREVLHLIFNANGASAGEVVLQSSTKVEGVIE